ncbi:GlxA family transcriptional regulator [Cupriavidus consociatus]|uniref:GlxA family transcriptional regulator n=1 Tax=Cupriavidus consociatus TaxID=2821357 RepID=UPI001AEB3176|nr:MULTISPECIES: helix-turn-helix domain-containing protein [unclassified Cupriavidus]MBP0621150.1 helix-turn-helix domain-containing protein [Cupriavidus sp. LEh25]MDK2657820.1 helix-turn-helix domain-containing protein [Cupriavidus sp. LEh21]
MYRAAVLAYDDCYASSLGGFADVLQIANAHLRQQLGARSSQFEWQFVSPAGGPITTSNGLQVSTQPIRASEKFSLVFVPSAHYAGSKAFDRLLARQSTACEWLKAQWAEGAYLAANCTGTFVLATTGLLDGRPATTTWWLADQFRRKFPRVDLQLDPVITEADRLVCAGASASYLLQTIHIIERFCGPVIASQCAKTMLIDVSQTKQTPYLPLLTDKAHADSLVHRAQHWLQKNMAKDVRMSEMASDLGVSERTIIRRFQAALDQSPLRYLQSLRIEAARTLLGEGDLNVEQVAMQVGYNDTSSFCRLFREKVGLSPGAYRGRFRGPSGSN